MLTKGEIESATAVELPALEYHTQPSRFVEAECFGAVGQRLNCIAAILKTSGKHGIQIQCDCGDKGSYILTTDDCVDDLLGSTGVLKVKHLELTHGTTLRGSGSLCWLKHPALVRDMWAPETVTGTWSAGPRLVPNSTGVGLRPPQIGALHALAAHWTLGERSAMVVMPTGTGKTEVMLAHMVMTRPKRLLVLVPSDALRTQTRDKFHSLGILHKFSIVDTEARRPVTAILTKGFKKETDFSPIMGANVVVSTVAMLDGISDPLRKSFLNQFDAVYFDEAHHLRATSWERIYKQLDQQRIVAFTATPYREDGKRIPLQIVYNFPLKLAQEQKYFREIDFLEVDMVDRDEADHEIARLAVERLRADEMAGYKHIILARAESREVAKRIYNQIYKARYADLNPELIFTGIRNKREIVRNIVAGKHRIVVCVDMFGEGFDMPTLKIAAMHDVHRSLAITLQFTGRFTRDATNAGKATLVANVAESRVSEAIEELYAEDPDWNQLIPKLSSKAVQTQLDFADFLKRHPYGYGEGEKGLFDLNVIRPKTSTVIYHAPSFNWQKFKVAFKNKKRTGLHLYWPSTDSNSLVFVTCTKVTIDWARVHETQDLVWDLYILAYDPATKLLFIHSSQKGTVHSELARAVTDGEARIVDGETPFKILHGINRLVLYSVGLYGKGRLRFRMLTGLDIADAISAATQSASTKSNIFGAGFVGGRRVTIGASAKGRIWSMSSSSIPDWLEWCKKIGSKIKDPTLRSNALLNHTLVPTPLTASPTGDILAVLPPESWLDGTDAVSQLEIGGARYDPWDAAFSAPSRNAEQKVEFSLVLDGQPLLVFRMAWGPEESQFALEQVAGPDGSLRIEGNTQKLAYYLREFPPVLLMIDGSEVRGGRHLKSPSSQPFTYPCESILTPDWGKTPIKLESKWKGGTQRPLSVQGTIIEHCVKASNLVVFDDDDQGEAADIIEILESDSTILIRLYHCKYSGGDEPGVRVKDLYEVCGQSVRSARLTQNPEKLIRHLEQRNKHRLNGRPTRFEKGDSRILASIRRRMRKLETRFEFVVVQPGLSKAALPAAEANILGAADVFLRETTGTGLKVIGSK